MQAMLQVVPLAAVVQRMHAFLLVQLLKLGLALVTIWIWVVAVLTLVESVVNAHVTDAVSFTLVAFPDPAPDPAEVALASFLIVFIVLTLAIPLPTPSKVTGDTATEFDIELGNGRSSYGLG